MEDEEGYMALNIKPTKKYEKPNLPPQIQDTPPRYSCCHQLRRGVGCTVIFLLIGAVVTLAIWVHTSTGFGCMPPFLRVADQQMGQSTGVLDNASLSQGPNNEQPSLENFVSHLRQYLCRSLDNKRTEICRLCPQNWSLHENKCYWVSKERQTWHRGKEDCADKLSGMLVIQTQEEVAFIQSITEGAQLLWIGLEATFPESKWTWIDGSPLDDKLVHDLSPVRSNHCGRLNGNQIISEVCSTIATWVCETEALLI